MHPQFSRIHMVLWAGLSAVLVGYLTVWLPGPAAGLQLIGFELGEWIKFVGVGSQRTLFYIPPIMLGLVIILFTTGWDRRNWRTWVMRTLGIAVSLLAFPAIASITSEPSSEWLARLTLIAAVILVALGLGLINQGGSTIRQALLVIVGLSVLGVLLPTGQYASVRPIVEELLGQSIGTGIGVWLNGVGFLLVGIVSSYMFTRTHND